MTGTPARPPHESFRYDTHLQLLERAGQLKVHIPFSEDTGILADEIPIGKTRLHNRLGIAPLEAADSMPNGAPSARTIERYRRYAVGGAGLIWVEAAATSPRARNGVSQLMLTAETLDAFRAMTASVKEAGLAANGFEPLLIVQAHHSGRFSSPGGVSAPMIGYRHPALDKGLEIDDLCILTDDDLRRVEDEFGHFAYLAKAAGFDGVDVKCCHGYLLGEMTSAYERPGMYGGSFENRTRLFRNCVDACAAHADSSFLITARLGIYDGMARPWGFGVGNTGEAPDMTEPAKLVRCLHEDHGIGFLNLSVGNPCMFKHYNRPFDHGPYVPDEHPLISLDRIFGCIGKIKRAVPEMAISASGLSYLRMYAGYAAAGAIREGICDHVLMGRMAFADPDFPNQILRDGIIDRKRVCVTCGKCEELLSSGKPAGCAVRAVRK